MQRRDFRWTKAGLVNRSPECQSCACLVVDNTSYHVMASSIRECKKSNAAVTLPRTWHPQLSDTSTIEELISEELEDFSVAQKSRKC
jgi:hypothetical protein